MLIGTTITASSLENRQSRFVQRLMPITQDKSFNCVNRKIDTVDLQRVFITLHRSLQ